jgi:hexosaminidase
MSKHIRLLILLALLCTSLCPRAQSVAIIPQPVSTQWGSGHFTLDAHTVLVVDNNEGPSASFFNDYLQRFYGLRLAIVKKEPASNYILLQGMLTPVDDAGPRHPVGSYILKVKPDAIDIAGDTGPGVFYGIQTLIQLLPLSPFEIGPNGPAIRLSAASNLSIPTVDITDRPRFQYRGLHLDCGRHFFPVDFVKKYIDYIALHKMNYFHWHGCRLLPQRHHHWP